MILTSSLAVFASYVFAGFVLLVMVISVAFLWILSRLH